MNLVLPTYEQYALNESRKAFESFMEIDAKKRLFESLSICPFLSPEERLFSELIIETNQWNFFLDGTLNEESIADKLKAKAKAALQTIKDKGKEYLSDTQEVILKIGGNISALIGKIMNVLKAFLTKAWSWIQKQVESGFAASKEGIIKAASGKFKGKADVAKAEVKNLGAMAKGAASWCTGGVVGDMEKGMNDAGKIDESFAYILENGLYLAASELILEDEEFVNYLRNDDLYESGGGVKIPFLSALAHKLSEVQPFKALHSLEHTAGDAANSGLGKISSVLSKVAKAPGPFEFTIVGAVFALVTGYAIKAGVKNIVHEIGASAFGAMVVGLIPGIGVILMCMKYAAKGIWCVGICETAIGIVSKGDNHEDEHSDEEEHKKEEKKEEE
jgi:hypothetical protein